MKISIEISVKIPKDFNKEAYEISSSEQLLGVNLVNPYSAL